MGKYEIYEGYKVYGPYLSKSENRRLVVLVSEEHRTTMSFARFLMTKKMGRWLTKDESVDHIDGNKLNDHIDNLQILTHLENVRKSAPPRKMVRLICPECGDEFVREHNRVAYVKNRKQPPCCSRSCSAKYQFRK